MARKKSLPKYLLIDEEQLLEIPLESLQSLSVKEAIYYGTAASIAIQVRLRQDALTGDLFVGKIKVVEGLEASLKVLYEVYPFLSYIIHSYTKNNKVAVA